MEIWKQIKDFPLYEVSNLGRFKNSKGKIRKWDYSSKKYIVVRISNEHQSINKSLHVLVIEAFISRPDYKCEVNHKDCNKSNNCLDNLEYVTHQENISHAVANGRMIGIKEIDRSILQLRGPITEETKAKMKAARLRDDFKRTNYILTDLQVYDIKKRHSEGVIMPVLAKEYNQTVANISLICSGKRRANISPEYNTVKRIPKRKAKRTR